MAVIDAPTMKQRYTKRPAVCHVYFLIFFLLLVIIVIFSFSGPSRLRCWACDEKVVGLNSQVRVMSQLGLRVKPLNHPHPMIPGSM